MDFLKKFNSNGLLGNLDLVQCVSRYGGKVLRQTF